MFDIFKSQQGVAQKPHLSAKNDNNFKAACGVLTISNIRDPQKDALFQAPYFVYQTLNYRKNIQNLKRGNRLAQTWTEPAGSRFSWNCYSRNSPETEPFVTLGWTDCEPFFVLCLGESKCCTTTLTDNQCISLHYGQKCYLWYRYCLQSFSDSHASREHQQSVNDIWFRKLNKFMDCATSFTQYWRTGRRYGQNR